VLEPVRSNSWRGEPADGPFAEDGARRWGVGPVPQPTVHLAPQVHDPWDWRRAEVGWGLLLCGSGNREPGGSGWPTWSRSTPTTPS